MLMKRLVPFNKNPSPSGSAVEVIALGSDPVPGSVNAVVAQAVPSHRGGMNFFLTSSEPKKLIVSATLLFIIMGIKQVEPVRPSSSHRRMKFMLLVPTPPYSFGTTRPSILARA